jgi:hypothetical protein
VSIPRTLQVLARLNKEADDVQFEFLDEISREETEALGFRWQSTRTQNNHNRTLTNYRAFTQASYKLGLDADDAATDKHAFPDDHLKLYQHCRRFIVYRAQYAKPSQIQSAGGHISYQT